MKYQFKNNEDTNKRLLICPECGEQLVGTDIEIFQACPYCDQKLERNCELEDFIIEPLVQRWINKHIMFDKEDNVTQSRAGLL
ncbi:MAG: hypothetical protein GY750_08645 [Lentisphaerae bacterium]|nr:hypothetical protein [Lentisphaerota bacterium]MCP4101478.1 hypothetical protein [Lentisphaerota bacterium]